MLILQMYTLLEDHVKQPKFLKQLEEAKEGNGQAATRPHGSEVFCEDWWEAPKGAAGPEAESDEGYLEVHLSHYSCVGQQSVKPQTAMVVCRTHVGDMQCHTRTGMLLLALL